MDQQSDRPSGSRPNALRAALKEFLFLKFHFKGDDLAKQIESPKWKEELEKLDPKILYKMIKKFKVNEEPRSDQGGVTIKLPIENNEVILEKLFLRLKAAAYYPWELDPPVFGEVHIHAGFQHVQRQLAYSANLGSWDAQWHLRMIAYCCTNLPKDHEIFENLQQEDPIEIYRTFRIPYKNVENAPLKASGTDTDLAHKETLDAIQHFDGLLELIQKGASDV